MSSESKYKSRTIAQKINAIRKVELGEKSKSPVAKEYGVSSSTLSTWLKNKTAILNSSVGGKRKRNKKTRFS
ncbi:hypothetical protein TKK_0004448 [Trichogramma kaykai]